MRYKSQRQKRYTKLKLAGFTMGEAKELSKVALTQVPYMKNLMRIRIAQVEEWQSKGFKTQQDIHRKIAEFYLEKGFVNRKTRKADVWALYRFVQKAFEFQYPSYVSPFRRKKRHFQPFTGR